ncbi:head GIN domain-containing protein [Chloroflexota bacterium]
MFKHAMPIVFLLVALLVGCTPPGATITASGNVVTQEEAISGFDKVEVSHAFQVDIGQGETFSVVVHIDDNLLQYLEVVKQGDTLKIGLTTDRISRDSTRQAEVTMPGLTGLDLSGASQATITGFNSANALNVGLSAASYLRGDIEAGDAQLDVADASQVSLRGSAGDLTLDASGASTVDLVDFPVVNANVEAHDASEVTVNASGTLDVDASGASQVYYAGSPTLGTIDTSGESKVEPK